MNKVLKSSWSRREFLQRAGCGVALGAAARWGIGAERESQPAVRRFLHQYGFWEYTTPYAGGFETYDYDDYLLALDDMAQGGMNSLLIVIKWLTTGYRSKLPYLDQLPGNKVIESDNELLRKVISEAKSRKMKVWLGAATSFYDVAMFGSVSCVAQSQLRWRGCPLQIGVYDPDAPMMVERSVEVFEEILDEFPDIDGLEFEMEKIGKPAPHRIPFYNKWAEANNRPPYNDPSVVKGPHWFDYQTASIIKTTKAVEKAVRAKGFRGNLATINKIDASYGPLSGANKGQAVNIEMMRKDCPEWGTINYTYEKGQPNKSFDGWMEAGITYAKNLGMNVYYLGRGVMTYGGWKDGLRLERSWTQDVADVQKFQPHNFWWFGAGGKGDGYHTSLPVLKEMGYADDVAARRTLLKTAAPLLPFMV